MAEFSPGEQFALIQKLHQIRATTMLDGDGDAQCDSVLDTPGR